MKRILLIVVILQISVQSFAQQPDRPRFDPEKFEAAKEKYIVEQAVLTPSEVSLFFPLYNELQTKKRALFERQRRLGFVKPQDNEACVKSIQEHDKIDVEMKKLEQSYHNKFLRVLPASKVFDIIKAENKFHRKMLKKFSNWPQHPDKN